MTLQDDLIAAGLPVSGTAIIGVTVFFTRLLTPAETDVYESIINPIAYRAKKARVTAISIPNWSTWTQTQLQNWWDTNLSDAVVDALAIPAAAKTVMKNQNLAILRIGQMVIALRDFDRIIE